ncbi:MAG: hypothetical protein WCJ19_05945 [bacterium]
MQIWGREKHIPQNIIIVLNCFKDIYNNYDSETVGCFIDSILQYGYKHGFSEEKLKGLIKGLLPAIENRDPQVSLLIRGGNIWGMGEGKYGVGDYICECFATRISPAGLNKLILFGREIPTNESSKFEQNRKDGLSLMYPFSELRDFIHDEQPGINALISAMISYYKDHDKVKLELAEKIIASIAFENKDFPDWFEKLFELSNYDMIVKENFEGKEKQVKAIDILKRLQENTSPFQSEPPNLKDKKLSELLNTVYNSVEELDKHVLNEALKYINNNLAELIKNETIGLEPNFIQALAWIERINYLTLKNMTYENQLIAHKQEWFQSILRFQELTGASDTYNEHSFQRFIDELEQSTSEEAYKIILKKITHDIILLEKRYQAMGKGYLSGALWSGNTYHELVGLTHWKPASTEYGAKHRKERLLPSYLINTGD